MFTVIWALHQSLVWLTALLYVLCFGVWFSPSWRSGWLLKLPVRCRGRYLEPDEVSLVGKEEKRLQKLS